MADVEETVRTMIEARKESVKYYEHQIEDLSEYYKGEPRALLRGTKFAVGQIETFEAEIDLLNSVLIAAGLAYNGEEV